MAHHTLSQFRSRKVAALIIVVLVLVAAVEMLARATLSTTNLLLNDLATEKSEIITVAPNRSVKHTLESKWAKVKFPEPINEPVTETPDKLLIRPAKDYQQWSHYENLSQTSASIERKLSFELQDNSLTARYDLKLEESHPLVQALRDGEVQAQPQALVDELLGSIAVYPRYSDDRELGFLGPYLEIDKFESKVHVWLIARPVDLANSVEVNANLYSPTVVTMPFASDHIVIKHPEGVQASVLGLGEVVRRDEKQLIFKRTKPKSTLVRLILPGAAAGTPRKPEETREVITQQRPTAIGVLRNLHINPPVFGILIFALLESLPLLLFLYFVSQSTGTPVSAALRNQRLIVGLFFVFHFGLYGLESIRQLPYLVDRLLGDMPLPDLQSMFPFLANSGSGLVAVALVLAGYLWPKFVQRSVDNDAIALAAEKVPLLRLLVVTALGMVAIVILMQFEELALGWMLLAWCGVGVLVLLQSISALLNTTLGSNRREGDEFRITLVLILLPVIGLLVFEPAYLPNLLIAGEPTMLSWLLPAAILLVAATPLNLYFAELTYRALTSRSLVEDNRAWSAWARVALLIGAVLLAYPSRWLVDGVAIPVNWRNILDLAYMLDNLIYLPFLWILLVILRNESKFSSDKNLTPMARNLGIVAALTFFYSPTLRFLYIPIVFFLGYVMLSRWLLVEDQKLSGIADKILDKRREIIQAMVSQNYYRRALRQMKRALVKKAEAPGFDLKAHEKRIDELENLIHETQAREPLKINNIQTQDLALAVGSSTSNWENGKRSALYSIFFSLPWIVLYVKDLAVSSNLNHNYLVLDFLSLTLSFVVKWSLYGFIFGYFFRSIRGRNGLQKGIYYFLALVVPHLAITILLVPAGNGDWPAFGFWTLQIFIHTMLLGLVAGDYESLRRSKLGLFQLIEIHNFSALASWASSTAIAIGAAIAAMLASVGPELIRKVFEVGRMVAPVVAGGG